MRPTGRHIAVTENLPMTDVTECLVVAPPVDHLRSRKAAGLQHPLCQFRRRDGRKIEIRRQSHLLARRFNSLDEFRLSPGMNRDTNSDLRATCCPLGARSGVPASRRSVRLAVARTASGRTAVSSLQAISSTSGASDSRTRIVSDGIAIACRSPTIDLPMATIFPGRVHSPAADPLTTPIPVAAPRIPADAGSPRPGPQRRGRRQ